MREVGYTFGPSFQRQIEIEAVAGYRSNRVLISLENPPSAFTQSAYAFHPACIDACFQAAAPSLWQCHRSSVNAMLIPTSIENLTINPQKGYSVTGIAQASAIFSGYGDPNIPENNKAAVCVYDSQTAVELLSFSGLKFGRLDNHSKTQPVNVYTKVSWDVDISLMDQIQFDKAYEATNASLTCDMKLPAKKISRLIRVFDLLCHRSPLPRVAELMSRNQVSSLWLENNQNASKHAFESYTLIATDQQSLLSLRSRYNDIPGVQVMLAVNAFQSICGDLSALADILILNKVSAISLQFVCC